MNCFDDREEGRVYFNTRIFEQAAEVVKISVPPNRHRLRLDAPRALDAIELAEVTGSFGVARIDLEWFAMTHKNRGGSFSLTSSVPPR
jgi:hypothetical protein